MSEVGMWIAALLLFNLFFCFAMYWAVDKISYLESKVEKLENDKNE